MGELAPFGAGVTVLCPSFFASAIMERSRFTGSDPATTEAAKTMMAQAKVQAPELAERALACCQRGQLYCVPTPDGQWGWRMKRLNPQHFYRKVMPAALKASSRS